jgi:hypothetical protein
MQHAYKCKITDTSVYLALLAMQPLRKLHLSFCDVSASASASPESSLSVILHKYVRLCFCMYVCPARMYGYSFVCIPISFKG